MMLLGLGAGCLLSWPLLAGDHSGQVNLLAVLLWLVGLPVFTLLLTLLALLRQQSWIPPAGWQHLPLLPANWKLQLRQYRLQGGGFWWLLLNGQWWMLGFSLGAVLALWLLLLFTDLHFVWRSTLLDAQDLAPVLRALAWPWSFWEAAQPSLELLAQTQGNRLALPDPQAPFSRWWAFVLAAQLFYVLLPRFLLLLYAAWRLRRLQAPEPAITDMPAGSDPDLGATTDQWPADALWLDAAWLPADVVEQLPSPPVAFQDWAGESVQPLVVVVRAWEPPLAELADRLRSGNGLILPLAWEGSQLHKPRTAHWQEWRRFVAGLPGWQVLQWP